LIEYLANPSIVKKNFVVVVALLENCFGLLAQDDSLFQYTRKVLIKAIKERSYGTKPVLTDGDL